VDGLPDGVQSSSTENIHTTFDIFKMDLSAGALIPYKLYALNTDNLPIKKALRFPSSVMINDENNLNLIYPSK
jgi:hypothetical protein